MHRYLLLALLWCGIESVIAAAPIEPGVEPSLGTLTHGALVVDKIKPASARTLELRGPLVQGGLVFGSTQPGSSVLHDGQPVPVSSDGEFVIGFARLAAAESMLKVELPGGKILQKKLTIAQRRYDIERIDGLPQEKVTPSPALSRRIAQEQAQVKQARSLNEDRTDFSKGFQWPVSGRISGNYGSQRILNGDPKWPHYGVDIARPEGTPVAAPAAAKVTLTHPDMFYSGATLIMDHGQGLSSTFLHLQKILVVEGQRVEKGEVVGLLGATGRATGPHLDWRMNLRGKRVDPTTVVGPMPKQNNVGERGI